ncbi:MAG TPA: phosphate ABC transporter substrate-binding/OmpA family protein [Candidatus Hydrogenedentes bacterium]|nr:phosphate ABC transporter substrate-binding/OmpA family protein [Candidatus Hydrogenedentota bacterium]HPG68645.1 phosphate ABC transporter substrate-binding/OmpA family protein [Candidatus Hydrogenedentota bacterium]
MSQNSAGGGPKAPFYIVVVLVVLGLAGYGLRGYIFPQGAQTDGKNAAPISAADLQENAAGTSDAANNGPEAPDANVVTTAKEYAFVPSEKLPPVSGVSTYEPLADRTVKFALNVWAGWAPIILFNEGKGPGKIWKTSDGQEFKVELVLIDDPVAMRDAYAAGKVHIGWATLDMVPLFMEELQKDSRIRPRIFQQVDWSNGGDGIVIRRSAAKDPQRPTIADLRGKKVVLAQNSPSQFFVLNSLISGGVQPAEVNFVYTQDAFQAAAAFNTNKDIAACVSWAPDIYNLTEIEGNHLLVTTATANKLIADVWFARADFAKDNLDLCEGLVRGIFDGMELMKTDAGKQQASEFMAKVYNIPAVECMGMLGDAHGTNYAENREFFMNQNNPANFERTWNTATYLYKHIGKISAPVDFSTVMDFSILQKLAGEAKYANSKNEYVVQFTPKTVQSIQAESGEILTKVVTVHFFPNSYDLFKKTAVFEDGKTIEKLYDPNVDLVLEEIGKLAAQYGAARIVIEGHTDSSMKGQIPVPLVKELSNNRANAVKEALVQKFPSLDPQQFSAEGRGWDVPADPTDPQNQAKNRRVEVKVYPLEAVS